MRGTTEKHVHMKMSNVPDHMTSEHVRRSYNHTFGIPFQIFVLLRKPVPELIVCA